MLNRARELAIVKGLLRRYPSMRAALADLGLQRLDVIHAGDETFPLAKNVRAVALQRLLADVRGFS
jgi:hypothetical protein